MNKVQDVGAMKVTYFYDKKILKDQLRILLIEKIILQ